MTISSGKKISVMWFRRDLRADDQHALYRALTGKFPVLPLFILDTHILNPLEKDDARVSFLFTQLDNLNAIFRQHGSSLFVMQGTPAECMEHLVATYDIDTIYANEDYEPYGIQRDKTLESFFHSQGISFHLSHDHLIFPPGEVLKEDGLPYTVYTPFMKRWRKNFTPEMAEGFPSENYLHHLLKEEFSFRGMEYYGFKKSSITTPPYNLSKDLLINYSKTRDIPAIQGTSGISPYLRFGIISIRNVVSKALNVSDVFLNELIWREFFAHILYHYPEVKERSFKKIFELFPWENNQEELDRWIEGTTGFPIVDAGMRQLVATGNMHNRVRMITASFLVKDLLVDWKIGEAFFARHLLDYELASNNGNWQWAAGTGCDATPFFRIFNPDTQQQRFDPGLEYIRRWIPEYGTPDYPPPMVNHALARLRALEIYKNLRRKK